MKTGIFTVPGSAFCSILMSSIIIFTAGCMEKGKSSEGKASLNQSDSARLTYELPSPATNGKVSVEKALLTRRSHRSFLDSEISAGQLSQILWAACGITKPLAGYPQMRGGLRTAPSAGALYPLELYVLIGKVEGIEPGVYKYTPQGHKIIRTIGKDVRKELSAAALNQEMIGKAPACLLYSAVFSRTTQRYGDRGRERYVCIDLGHSAENVYLQAEALGLGTCAVGAFNDIAVKNVMQLPAEEEPLYMMPIGKYYDVPEF